MVSLVLVGLRLGGSAVRNWVNMKDEPKAALERYLTLAEEVENVERAAALALNATADPHLYSFGELLASPKLDALKGTKFQSSHDLLRLFAYENFSVYAKNKSAYPPLSPSHERKLKLLSVASLAHQANSVSYDSIRTCLQVTSIREVEDAVLDAIYAGLLRARLDQRTQSVEVLAASGRDVPPGAGIPDMLALLEEWANSAGSVVSSIDAIVGSMQGAAANAARERTAVESEIAAVRTSLFGSSAQGSTGREQSPRAADRTTGVGSVRFDR